MRSSKQIYNSYFNEYKLDKNMLEILQKELLCSFLDIKKVFDKYDIKYMMSGGTLLGTVRHKGFIPWDDDIDIMMCRQEYEKFRRVFEQELGEVYELAEPLDYMYFYKMPKIYKKNTVFVEIPFAGVEAYNKMFIDIFIIENVPDSVFLRNIRARIYDFAYKGASACIDYLYPSPVIEEKANDIPEVKAYYRLRKRIGFFFCHIGGIKFYLKLCDKLGRYSKQGKYYGVPAAISYKKEILPREVFSELTEGEFCGNKVNIPKNYDKYLENLYGDYMSIPPLEKQEVHVAYRINI